MSDEKLLEELEKAKKEISKLETALEAEKLRLKISSEFSNFGLWEYDIATDTCYQLKKLNGRYENYLEPIVNFRDSIIKWGSVCTDDLPAFNRFCDCLERGDKEIFAEIRMISDNCEIVWQRYEGRAVYDENGKPVKIEGRTLDVTEEKGGISGEVGGILDPMTGLYTPQLFRDRVTEKRSGVKRYNSAALLSISIDNFRNYAIRDSQDYSDYLQVTVGRILKSISNGERDCLLTRLRDGEYLMYLEFTEIRSINDIAKRIVDSVRDYLYEGEPCTISMGIAMMKNGRKLDEVYSEALAAMNEAYKSGGCCYMHYTMTMSMSKLKAAEACDDFNCPALSGRAAKVYNLIIAAFCSEGERYPLIQSAIRTTGEFLGARAIYFFDREGSKDGSFIHHSVYRLIDGSENDNKGFFNAFSDEDLCRAFGDSDRLRLHPGGEKIRGLTLSDNAVCAELRAIRYDDKVDEAFAIIFDSSFELSNEDIQVIDALENALVRMRSAYLDKFKFNSLEYLRNSAVNDHRIECFTIHPDTFEVDSVGTNAADHYGLCKGDICYKKMRGRSEPCEICPALQLKDGRLSASSAYFDNGDQRWLDVIASVSSSETGDVRYVISSADITDCLGKVRMVDSLTGVMTFDVFTAEALRLTTASREEAGNFAVVINVADFRMINEKKGFEFGNSILIAIADILRRCIVSGELLGRSEGSRFVCLLKNEDMDDLKSRMFLMMNSIQKQIYERFQIMVYLLVGACDMNDENVGVMGALDRAITAQKTVSDRTFYRDHCLAFYDKAQREKIKERRYIEEHMFEALDNDEFKVFYQPKVSIRTGKVVGAEALVRWIKSDGEIISPGKFIPIFEENGFISNMDFAIYRHAVADIRSWLRKGLDVPLVSLNVSRHHLADENFCSKLNSLIDSIGVPHEYVELEITESLLTENMETLIEMVTWLKDKGYRISVDDFGSGYSSLNLITMLPFDTLKIDGGFFLKNDLTDKNKKVITSVVTLAKSLNLETVSEGVETQTQVDFLKGLGCDTVQGFFYYRPMPRDEFEKLLVQQSTALT